MVSAINIPAGSPLDWTGRFEERPGWGPLRCRSGHACSLGQNRPAPILLSEDDVTSRLLLDDDGKNAIC